MNPQKFIHIQIISLNEMALKRQNLTCSNRFITFVMVKYNELFKKLKKGLLEAFRSEIFNLIFCV